MLTTTTNGVHHATDEQIDALYAWMPGQTPAPQACPEAQFSLTLKGTVGGHEALLTVRAQRVDEFKNNLTAVQGLLDQIPAPPPPTGDLPRCPDPHHGYLRKGKGGHLYCPTRLADGSWCKAGAR